MTIRDAMLRLEADDIYQWARPVSWRGTGQAIMVHGRHLQVVPRGSHDIAYYPHVLDILDEWEVVNPNVVLGEDPGGYHA